MQYPDFHNETPSAADLREARLSARMTPEQAATLCGMHRSTYYRQESGASRVNLACYRLLLCRCGWLPPPLEGWSVGRGSLWSPEGVAFSPGEIRALPLLYALIRELRRELGQPMKYPENNVHPIREQSG